MNNLAASVRARLLNVARAQGADFNQVLVRFALERILYRLSRSEHAERFLLKGALLFTLWYDMPHRTTRDADLLGFGASDLESLVQTFRDIASVPVDDGIAFDPASVGAEEIRKEAGYAGARITINAELARARCRTQIDIGFGDAVTPDPINATYPVLLGDLPAPKLRTYPVYTVVAEKLHAIALLGMVSSRMKDYFDLAFLLEREDLDTETLARAIAATFVRRGMVVSGALPIGLTNAFAADTTRQRIWLAFLRKIDAEPRALADVVTALRSKLEPVLRQATMV